MSNRSKDPSDYIGGTYNADFPSFGPLKEIVDIIESHTKFNRSGNVQSTCEIRLECGHRYQRYGSYSRFADTQRARCPECSLEDK